MNGESDVFLQRRVKRVKKMKKQTKRNTLMDLEKDEHFLTDELEDENLLDIIDNLSGFQLRHFFDNKIPKILFGNPQ